jgi:hypothetical protein
VDIAHGEMAEKQLDALIQRRARKGNVDPDEAEEIWKESVRRYNARRRKELDLERYESSRGTSTTAAKPSA